ncbi:MAG: hypothetical protein R2825_18480 [Saprospiraceae bacterium]
MDLNGKAGLAFANPALPKDFLPPDFFFDGGGGFAATAVEKM